MPELSTVIRSDKMRELFAKILYEIEKQNDLILVTLTDNDGSAPRKTGAFMLVGPKGRILGTIGGGAVELRSVEMAQQLIGEKRSDLHPFYLNTNRKEDIGMICGGDVTALFQFIGADDPVWKELCGRALEELSGLFPFIDRIRTVDRAQRSAALRAKNTFEQEEQLRFPL